jgi:predicted kinase
MTRLIHLNGLPGVGKSTLARRYAEEHRFALNLDVDLLRRSLGQWQEHPTSGLQARRLAIAALRLHLRDGFDVVVPQFLVRPDFLVDLDDVATDTDAEFIEVWVRAPLDVVKRRFRDRTDAATEPQHVEAAQMIGGRGYDAALDEMSRDLEVFLRRRNGLIAVDTDGMSPEQSYRLLVASLRGAAAPTDHPGHRQ